MIYGEHESKFVIFKVNNGEYHKLAERENFGYKKMEWHTFKLTMADHKFTFYLGKKS